MTRHLSESRPGAHRAELFLVAAALLLLHIVLLALHLPLAQRDLSAYMEPGFYLAQTGRLAGPASQHMDLTSISGYYFYPPGYFLLIGLWVKLFGHGPDALLAFTGIAHFSFTFGLWVLLRRRLHATAWGTALVVASVFAGFNHGRPDVVALMFGTLAWLLIGTPSRRLFAAGLLLSAACLNSPAEGLGACGVIGGYELSRGGFHRSSWLRVSVLAAIVAAGVAGVVISVLTWQGAWALARDQWHVQTTIRGSELKTWPSFRSTYMIVFCAIPLGLLTIPCLAAALPRSKPSAMARSTAAGYILGAAVQLIVVPADFLTHRHFSYLGRPALQAAQTQLTDWLRRVAYIGLIYYVALNTYFHKNQIWPLVNDRDRAIAPVVALQLPPDVWLATDSQFFPLVYRPDRTISYEIYRVVPRWQAHRALTPDAVFEAAVPQDRRARPIEPSMIVIAAATIEDIGPPPEDRFVLVTPDNLPMEYRVFGRPIRLCANPFAPVVYIQPDRIAELLPLVVRAGFQVGREVPPR